jgi:type II secretory pathway predicted ATPase ExeA
MDLASAGLTEQPFRTHGKPILTVPYASYREALKALGNACTSPDGLVLLQGPALAGKSTIIRQFVDTLEGDFAVAVVDGNGLNTTQLLESILRQFGYELDYNSANELFGMLRVFALQQAARHEAPLVVVENAHALRASALRALGELADLKVRHTTALRTSAVKLVLASDYSLRTVAPEEVLTPLYARVTSDFHLRPMTRKEATYYLYQKLSAAGSSAPEYVFPSAVCDALYEASGGWPGVLDRIALLALARATSLPVSTDRIEHPVLPAGTWEKEPPETPELDPGTPPEPPRLVISKDGKPLNSLNFDKARLLVGRSEHNDISIPSRFVSRHHLLLVRHGNSTFLMDLNSTNGTLVNSKRVSNQVLAHEDVISIGNHRIKFYDTNATAGRRLDGDEFADTAIMKTLEDMRNLLAQENTATLPAVRDDETPGVAI